ncbi:MAG: efflux RND transporter periplasmic adaptor subunit [Acidimicrobiales bacterium]
MTSVVAATAGTITHSIAAHGIVQPAQVANLNFTVSGRVSAVDVKIGQIVSAGQVLASVAPTALDAQEAAATATLASAQAKLSQDHVTHAAAAQLTADEASVVSGQVALATARQAVAAAELTSPIAGTVSTVSLTVSQQVSATGTPGGGSPPPPAPTPTGTPPPSTAQVTVVSAGRFVVTTSVDDTQVTSLAVGDRVLVSVTGKPSAPTAGTGRAASSTGPGKGIQGKVASVGMVPVVATGIPTFPVTVDVTGTPAGVYAGTGARLSIVVKQLTGVIEVPTPAVTYRGAGPTVTVVEPGGRKVVKPVGVGATSNGKTQITHGLSAGQKVVVRTTTASAGSSAGQGGTGNGTSVPTPGPGGPARSKGHGG